MRAIDLVAAWLATYALHSTLLLGAAWALTRWVVRAHGAREVIWKAALLGGLLSASVQVAAGFEPLLGRLNIARTPAAQSAPADELSAVADKDATRAARSVITTDETSEARAAKADDVAAPPS